LKPLPKWNVGHRFGMTILIFHHAETVPGVLISDMARFAEVLYCILDAGNWHRHCFVQPMPVAGAMQLQPANRNVCLIAGQAS